MRRRRIPALPCVLAALASLAPSLLAAQDAPWSAPLRGAWVRTGPAQAGDVVLAGGGRGSEIVVGPQEGANARQAAVLLAGDIERISGSRPPSVAAPDRSFTLLDTPDKLWYASDAVLALLDRLYARVQGDSCPPPAGDTLAVLRARQPPAPPPAPRRTP